MLERARRGRGRETKREDIERERNFVDFAFLERALEKGLSMEGTKTNK